MWAPRVLVVPGAVNGGCRGARPADAQLRRLPEAVAREPRLVGVGSPEYRPAVHDPRQCCEDVLMPTEPKSATFETTVAASGNNTGIVVPVEVIEELGAGKRPSVLVNLNGYEYRSTAAVMGGQHMISISAAVRVATGLTGGDPIRVTLTVADTPREVEVPADFAAALADA